MESNDHEWELCKENVQPLRQGRHMSALVAALHSESGYEEEQLGIKSQQNEFEMELRQYSGDDPLDVWDRYIKWTEQYYPKGGHEGQLMKLIEQCLKLFQNDSRYTNDPRFIQIWLKFAHSSEDPVEVFNYMFDIGIGSTIAQVYIEWATMLERSGDLKRADTIYIEGLNRCPQAKESLKHSHYQFQNRVAQNITLQVSENRRSAMLEGEEKEKRSALSRLKTHGSQGKVGVARVGNAKLGLAGTLRDCQAAPAKQIPGKKFQIFCDENAPPSLQPQQTEEWQSIPEKAVTNRENEKKRGVWTDAKMKQKPGNTSTVPQRAPFEIHEDPCATPQHHAPKTAMFNSQPLSSRKNTSNPDVLGTLRQPMFTPNTGIPMYQKEKIYNGIMEFSFEELRASLYWKRCMEREALKREEERKQREEWVQKQLEEQKAKIAALEAALHQTRLSGTNSAEIQNTAGLANSFNTPTDQLIYSSGSGISSGSARCDSPEMMDTSTSSCLPISTADHRNFASTLTATAVSASSETLSYPTTKVRSSTPMEEEEHTLQGMTKSNSRPLPNIVTDTTPSNSISIVSAVPVSGGAIADLSTLSSSGGVEGRASSSSSISRDMGGQPVQQQSQSHSSFTASSSAGPTPESFTFDRGPLTAPSPTVHTKEAFQDILGMFNSSIYQDSFTGPTPNTKTPSKSQELSASKEKVCFPIFEDAMQTDVPSVAKSGFFIREDTTIGSERDIDKGTLEMIPRNKDENVNMSRGSNSSKSARKMGFVIYQENTQDTSAGSLPTPRTEDLIQNNGPFKIRYGELQDENSCPRLKGAKQSTRRGLAFSVCQKSDAAGGDDEIMSDLTHYPEFTIEYQAKHDQTLAPLDHFTQHARAASTPFAGNQNKSLLSQQHQSQESSNIAATASSSTSASITGSLVSTFGATNVTPSKDLSPILEGSNEDSNDDVKSLQSTEASRFNVMLRSRHASTHSQGIDPIQEIEDDGNVSMQNDEQRQEKLPHVEANADLDRSCHHQIDTTTYIPDQEQDERTEALLSASICIDPKDPFDDTTIAHFLATLDPPIQDYSNYIQCKGPLPECETDQPFNELITFDECIGEGGYAKVWKVSKFLDCTIDANSLCDKALKIQKSGGQWEFYITSTLVQRLKQLKQPMDIRSAILHIENAYFFDNGSALEMDYINGGSILNLVNLYRQNTRLRDGVEPFACLLTIELLHLFEQMHACQIIHGDVKPDNFLMMDLPEIPVSNDPCKVFGSELKLVKLIDFGQSIDMTKFPPGTTFTAKVETSGFQCIEMKTNRPWTYQTDLFGLAGTIHVVLFGSYMNVFQEHGEWRTTGNFARKWNTSLWKRLFKELLNVPSCWQQPDLAALRAEFEQHFISKLLKDYSSWACHLRLDLHSS
ncbi:mitotic checkpoint serine/threonine-protein kinase bub1-like [Plakobranchus ocellatus]|uniref:Mitotic checkpoint serine/threonine-protein kinase bub1-like n=1 Tax=Plakobranchus ocellatus TaxID=259542 RepID=A0AAV4DU68_9GAST|nr:mitotic checkpoint serine/threonine-protein kinase bub1-like [Plakobranchus ocellatus]